MDRYRLNPGKAVNLGDWDPSELAEEADEKAGKRRLESLRKRLEKLQELLYASGSAKLLVVLQAMDTGGKDGVIRRVFDGVNPVGVKVASYKRPAPEELAHDYLWRVHQHTPRPGEIVIFNRSHYEDVLVVRVKELVPKQRWERRYRHIVEFERLLAEEGTTIVKFYLHISKDEQRRRLQARLDDPDKRWKFAREDLVERERWDDYMTAYQAVLTHTSSSWAPWYLVPADHKWYRDLVVSSVIVRTLEGLDLRYPAPTEDLTDVVVK